MKSDKKDKKFKAIVNDKDSKKTVHFGQAGASDMTKHGDETRKVRYIHSEYITLLHVYLQSSIPCATVFGRRRRVAKYRIHS